MCNRKGADDNGHMAEEPRAWKARTRGSEAEVDGVIRPSTVTGLCCAVGCVRIGASHKRNSRFTWDSLSLFTTCESGAKRCWVRSLSYSSHKTPESNKRVGTYLSAQSIRGLTDTHGPQSSQLFSRWCLRRKRHSIACVPHGPATHREGMAVRTREGWHTSAVPARGEQPEGFF